MKIRGADYQIQGMEASFSMGDYPCADNSSLVGGGGAAWYASKEAVGLGRDVSPSSDNVLPEKLPGKLALNRLGSHRS
jgi:hypothetical protein